MSQCNTNEAETVFVIRDASGEYLTENGDRTPAAGEAHEYESREEAESACERTTDKVYARKAD